MNVDLKVSQCVVLCSHGSCCHTNVNFNPDDKHYLHIGDVTRLSHYLYAQSQQKRSPVSCEAHLVIGNQLRFTTDR